MRGRADSAPDRGARRHPASLAGAAAALALVTAAAFVNAAPSVALHDDGVFAALARQASWTRIVQAFHEDTWASVGRAPAGTYRPVFLGLIQVEGLLFADAPRALHVTGIVLHVVTTVVLFGLLRRVLRDAGRPSTVAAWVAALVFGVHPVHTEAVDSFFNASEVIATLGTYAALWLLWTSADTRPGLAWVAVSGIYLLTLFCRESAATMPALFALVLFLLRYRGPLRERAARLTPLLILLVPFGLYAVVRSAAAPWPAWAFSSQIDNYLAARTWTDRTALVASTAADAWKLMVWPRGLRISYDEYEAHDVALAIALNVVVLGLAAVSWRRRPAITVGAAAFYLSLLPSTALLQDLMVFPGTFAERYLYLPSAALTFPLAFGLARLASAWGAMAVGAVGAAACVVLMPLTLLRNEDWHSDVALYEADYRTDPANGRAAALLVDVYTSDHRLADAVGVCDGFLAAHPGDVFMGEQCADTYGSVGRVDDALAALRRVAEDQRSPHTLTLLARLYLKRGERARAEEAYEAAVERSGNLLTQHIRRGEMLLRMHPERAGEAAAEFRAALALDPGDETARRWLRATSGPHGHDPGAGVQ